LTNSNNFSKASAHRRIWQCHNFSAGLYIHEGLDFVITWPRRGWSLVLLVLWTLCNRLRIIDIRGARGSICGTASSANDCDAGRKGRSGSHRWGAFQQIQDNQYRDHRHSTPADCHPLHGPQLSRWPPPSLLGELSTATKKH
jgi:hypothetical protein